MRYTKFNEAAWDKLAENADDWTVPVSTEEYKKALARELVLYLTPAKQVPVHWFPKLKGAKFLGLASGGGRAGRVSN